MGKLQVKLIAFDWTFPCILDGRWKDIESLSTKNLWQQTAKKLWGEPNITIWYNIIAARICGAHAIPHKIILVINDWCTMHKKNIVHIHQCIQHGNTKYFWNILYFVSSQCSTQATINKTCTIGLLFGRLLSIFIRCCCCAVYPAILIQRKMKRFLTHDGCSKPWIFCLWFIWFKYVMACGISFLSIWLTVCVSHPT